MLFQISGIGVEFGGRVMLQFLHICHSVSKKVSNITESVSMSDHSQWSSIMPCRVGRVLGTDSQDQLTKGILLLVLLLVFLGLCVLKCL